MTYLRCFREDLKTVLEKNRSSLTVSALLESLQITVEYEALMAKKFNVPVSLSRISNCFLSDSQL
jgi:hypothetical protein